MSSITKRPATYGRRGSQRKHESQKRNEDSSDESSPSPSPSTKRRKVEPSPARRQSTTPIAVKKSPSFQARPTPKKTGQSPKGKVQSPVTARAGERAKRPQDSHGGETDVDTDMEDMSKNCSASMPTTPSRPKSTITYLSRTPSGSRTVPAFQDLAKSSTPLLSPSQRISPSTGPLAPKSPAKDISKLFDFSPSVSPTKSQAKRPEGGIAKRMLARSRTEPAIPSPEVSPRALSRTSGSMASISSRQAVDAGSQEDLSHNLSSPVRRSLSPTKGLDEASTLDRSTLAGTSTSLIPDRPSTRTYAGKSRSFLVALPMSALAGCDPAAAEELLQSQEEAEMRESYTDLRARYGVDNSDDVVDGSGSAVGPSYGLYNDLKSITDLRSRGESRRFMDEVGYLFEGLDKSEGINVRRGSALEIVAKLCDTDFARKAKAADFLSRAWDVCRDAGVGEGDKVLDSTIALFAALVAQESRSLAEIADRASLLDFLFDLLTFTERQKDPLLLISVKATDARLRAAGFGRTEVTMLRRLHSLVTQKSNLFDYDVLISTRLLASLALSSVSSDLLDATKIPSLYSTLSSELALLSSRIPSYMTGLDILPKVPSASQLELPSFQHIANCLSLLDTFFLGRWTSLESSHSQDTSGGTSEPQESLVRELVMLWVGADIICRSDVYADSRETAEQCIELALRVTVNLSHGSPKWSSYLLDNELTLPTVFRLIMTLHGQLPSSSTSGMTPDGDEKDGQSLDRLCLALALLTNLVQGDERAKNLVRATMLDPACPGKRLCTYACCCADRVSGLKCLCSIFSQSADSTDELDIGMQFLYGHLAILLGLLMRDNPTNRSMILASLPSKSDERRLDSLVTNGRNLLSLHSEIAKRLSKSDAASGELQDEDMKDTTASESTMHAMQDARHVLSFLESLRNTLLDTKS